MKHFFVILVLFSTCIFSQNSFLTPYERGNGNQTTTYEEMRTFYNDLDRKFETIKIETYGEDDNGEPIRVVVFNNAGKEDAPTVLINNGIHPGESDGIDATMMLMRDLASGKINARNLKIAAIECYNISGMMRRGKFSRANQNGPEEYGFRGNARNYDLNRDFIKADSENAKTFQKIFHQLNPIYFIDNHVSNGADYQYLFTYISTNKERLGVVLGKYLHEKMQPEILKSLEKKGILTTPYVNIHGDSPDAGFPAFMDTPRYATGYTTLFNTLGTVAETHMLKSYTQRVFSTYEYMLSSIAYVSKNSEEIQAKTKENLAKLQPESKYAIQWEIDSTKFQRIDFKGYEASTKPSDVSGKPRLFYDKNKPFLRKVKFYQEYKPTKEIMIPNYYVIPRSEKAVLQNLSRNNIAVMELKRDSILQVEVYQISDFKTVNFPYEGHYLHYDTRVSKHQQKRKILKGDFLVSTQQKGIKYLLETLEPEATDSFFNWNFFDAILNQKEYFSDYVFEDTASALLKNNPSLRVAFDKAKMENSKLAEDANAQLDWVYKHSEYYEKTVREYPIFRVFQKN